MNTATDQPEALPFAECHRLHCWEYGKQPDEEIADGRDTWWTEYWRPDSATAQWDRSREAAETGTGSVHESPVLAQQECAQNPSQTTDISA